MIKKMDCFFNIWPILRQRQWWPKPCHKRAWMLSAHVIEWHLWHFVCARKYPEHTFCCLSIDVARFQRNSWICNENAISMTNECVVKNERKKELEKQQKSILPAHRARQWVTITFTEIGINLAAFEWTNDFIGKIEVCIKTKESDE